MVASSSYDNKIKMFKEEDDDWVCFSTLTSHDSTVWSLAFDATGDRLASCSEDGTVKIWKSYRPGNAEGIPTSGSDPTWKCVSTLGGYHSRPVYDIAWCPLTGYFATGTNEILRISRVF